MYVPKEYVVRWVPTLNERTLTPKYKVLFLRTLFILIEWTSCANFEGLIFVSFSMSLRMLR